MVHRNELVSSIIVVVFGVVVVMLSGGIDTVAAIEKSGVVNSRFFPRLMGLFFVGLGGLLVIRNVLADRRSNNETRDGEATVATADTEPDQSPLRLTIAIAIAILYAALFRRLGFPVVTFLAVTAYSILLGSPKKYLPPIIGVAVATTLYVAFRYALGLVLPLGILSEIL